MNTLSPKFEVSSDAPCRRVQCPTRSICSILVARTASLISDWGAENGDFPNIFAKLEMRCTDYLGGHRHRHHTILATIKEDEELCRVVGWKFEGWKRSSRLHIQGGRSPDLVHKI